MNPLLSDQNSHYAAPIFKNLVRLFRELSLLPWMVISLLFSLVGALLPQGYTWMVGNLLRCEENECSRTLSFFSVPWDVQIGVTTLLYFCIITYVSKCAAWAIFELQGHWASQKLHARVLESLGRTGISLFDESPSGVILGRLVGDYGHMRLNGMINIGDTYHSALEMICLAYIMSMSNMLAAMCVLPCLLAFLYFQRQYAPMSARVESLISRDSGVVLSQQTDLIVCRPLFNFYNKAVGQVALIQESLRGLLDLKILRARLICWNIVWMGFTNAIFAAVAYGLISIALIDGKIDKTLAAVIISALFMLQGIITWFSQSLSGLSNSAVYAHRLFELLDLPDETVSEGRILKASSRSSQSLGDFSEDSVLSFINYSMSYRSTSELIFKDFNLDLPMCRKVGIIGRTGSGKSSLVQALFRLVYVHSGDIQIGGRSIYAAPIDEVRHLFGYVPQVPIILPGTLRFNLIGSDRVDQDQTIESVLARMKLSLPLDHMFSLAPNGLSLGQSQLIGLARVILSKRKIVVLDEPTSSIDSVAEELFSSLLAEETVGKTVIMIAHRLETLKGFDWIVELDSGRVMRAGPAQSMF